MDDYWKQSIPFRGELLLKPNRNFSPLIGLLDHEMDSVIGRTGLTYLPFPIIPDLSFPIHKRGAKVSNSGCTCEDELVRG